jgi:G3E family GTPase
MLSAGGKVFVASDNFSWLSPLQTNAEQFENIAVDFSAQTVKQIKNHLSHLEVDLRESLSGLADSMESAGLSEENLQQIKIQIEEGSRLAAQKAELAAVKAQAKVEKAIAKAQRKAQKMKRKTREFDLDQFFASQAEKKSVSDSERLMILEMLQEKKISPEEADDLLKALEGKKKR